MSTAPVTTAANNVIQSISIEEHADLHEASQPIEQLDIGSALIQKILHPVNGIMILIATSSGDYAALPIM